MIAAFGSGVLLVFSFPNLNQGWLAWVALMPLFFALLNRKSMYAFFISFLSGVVCFGLTFSWMFEVTGYRFFHHALLQLYLGCFLGLFGLAFSYLSRRFSGTMALLAAPFIWVSLEYIRSNLGFMAYPTTLLAHSQYAYVPIIQIASITGAYGISFLIVMVNSAFIVLIFSLFYRAGTFKLHHDRINSELGRLGVVGSAGLLIIVSLMYGLATISNPIVGERIKLSVLQGNIEQGKKWDPKNAASIMQTYESLTQEVSSKDKPELISISEFLK